MRVVKIRRVGNSNVLSIPREFERLGYCAGVAVVVDEGPAGDLRVVTAAEVSTLLLGAESNEATEDPGGDGDGQTDHP
jgi:antitoxin component of MazEF toxin-antitoxin module